MQRHDPNPFTDPDVASRYQAWYGGKGRRADHLEKALLERLLGHFPQADTVLEVGCGSGHFTRWFGELGLQPTGLDRSRPMLAEAVNLDSPPCVRGDALALPFSSDAFDLVVLVTTLEFLAEPVQALAEAFRVAHLGLLLGTLNRRSLLGRQLKSRGGPIWSRARFFTPGELTNLVQRAAAGRQIEMLWQTTLWPVCPARLRLPWGGFIGMAVMLS